MPAPLSSSRIHSAALSRKYRSCVIAIELVRQVVMLRPAVALRVATSGALALEKARPATRPT